LLPNTLLFAAPSLFSVASATVYRITLSFAKSSF